VKTYQGTSFCLVWINWYLERELAPDKTFCKVMKNALNGVCFAYFFPFIFHSKMSVECFASMKIMFSDCYCVFFCDRGW